MLSGGGAFRAALVRSPCRPPCVWGREQAHVHTGHGEEGRPRASPPHPPTYAALLAPTRKLLWDDSRPAVPAALALACASAACLSAGFMGASSISCSTSSLPTWPPPPPLLPAGWQSHSPPAPLGCLPLLLQSCTRDVVHTGPRRRTRSLDMSDAAAIAPAWAVSEGGWVVPYHRTEAACIYRGAREAGAGAGGDGARTSEERVRLVLCVCAARRGYVWRGVDVVFGCWGGRVSGGGRLFVRDLSLLTHSTPEILPSACSTELGGVCGWEGGGG